MSRRATGLKRPYPLQSHWDAEEFEYVSRKSLAARMSKTELLREYVLVRNWRSELAELRRAQKHLPAQDFVPAPNGRSADVG